jgi:FtsP/CotA-like multicopper oxidase with cupredoxin domain
VRFPTHSQDAGAIPFEFDVPLIFHDRQFDADGVDFFPLGCLDGAIGDRCTVNGTIQPHMRVQPRRYRFRLYVGGPSRFMWIWLRRGLGTTDYLPMTVIASDGNLLPAAIEATSFKQSPGERFDVIVDFSKFRPGTELYLTNRAEQRGANGPTGKLLEPGASLDYLKFIVDPARAGLTDDSTAFRNGTLLRPLPPLPEVAGARRKEWVWGKSGSAWSASGEFYDRYAPVYEISGESTEVWTHKNGGGSWSHPIHAHFEESRLIGQKGTAMPAPNLVLERGRKDTFRLDPSASVDVATQFRDFRGIYPVHCHNNIHEDHGMMAMFKVV